MSVEIFEYGEDGANKFDIVGHLIDHGYVVFSAQHPVRRELSAEIIADFEEGQVICFEIETDDWPMCLVDCQQLGVDGIDWVKSEIKNLDT